MNNNPNQRVRYPVAMLVAAGKRFVKAYKNDVYGPQVLEGLAPEFPTDYEAALAALVKSVEDQTIAKGNVHVLTTAQRDALDDFRWHARFAKQAAREAFASEEPLLHSDFQIGQNAPADLPSIIQRGRKLVIACKQYAEPLAAQGWPSAHTTALEAALKTLEDASVDQDQNGANRAGLTKLKGNLGDAFYRQCRAIQCVAQIVYPAMKAGRDATVREARGLFLLDVFPPRRGGTLPPEDPPASAGTATAPSGGNPAGGTPAGA